MSWRSDGCRFSGVHIARKLWADTEEGKCLNGEPVKDLLGLLMLGGFNTLFGTGFFETSVLAEPEDRRYVLRFPGSQLSGILPPDSIRWFSFEIR